MKKIFRLLLTKLSWRFFLLFFIAAVIPIVILAGASYQQISKQLQREAHSQMRDMSKSIGMDIYEKIRYINSEFELFLNSTDSITSENAASYLALSKSENLFIMSQTGDIDILAGRLEPLPQALIANFLAASNVKKTSVIFHKGATNQNRMFMLKASKNDGLAAIELAVDELWNTEYLNSLSEKICILSPESKPLFCNWQHDASWIDALKNNQQQKATSTFLWQDGAQELFTTYWTIFLAPHFSFPKWTVSVSKSPDIIMEPVEDFQRTFLRIFLLTMALVTLLSTLAIRKNLEPLDKLVTATKRISHGNFAERVDIDSENELHELAESFNLMSEKLGGQFNQLKILADLDNSFQRANTLEGITQALIDTLNHCGSVVITTVACKPPNQQNLFVWTPNETRGRRELPHYESIPVPENTIVPSTFWVGEPEKFFGDFPLLSGHVETSASKLIFAPASRESNINAFAILEPTKQTTVIDGELQQLLKQIIDLFGIKLESFFLSQNLHFLAHHDSLTGLPNRTFLLQALEKFTDKVAGDNLHGAVILIDIDKFKTINDSQGHAAGDELLLQIAKRFKNIMRSDDIISRLSGDEFIAILSDLPDNRAAEITTRTVDRINQVLKDPFSINEREHQITVSMGVAFFPKDGNTPAEVLQAADAAMYAAKSSTNDSNYDFYSEQLHNQLLEQIEIESSILSAIAKDEFVLHYQPINDLQEGRTIAAEALVRWHHAEKGLMMPNVFIGIAEKSTLIDDLGNLVLNKACQDLARWKADGIDIRYVSINVSGKQLSNSGFIDQVLSTLEKYQLSSDDLVLEVTETTIIENYETGRKTLDTLRNKGLKISIDDFGTGFSSLSYLKQLPADYLKIDRAFVSGLPDDPHDTAIIKSLISLAENFGLGIVAEGVETDSQMDLLSQLGVKAAQGYHFSRPLPAADLIGYISNTSS